MGKNIKFSIIVPVYNAERFVGRCIESILSQSDPNFELILIDDGSKDGSAEICSEYARRDPRVKLIRSANRGVSAARNRGLDEATGEMIGFCDADDMYAANCLLTVRSALEKEQTADALIGNFTLTGCIDRKADADEVVDRSYEILSADETIERVLLDRTVMGSVWNKFYRRELIGGIRFRTDLAFMEDTFFNVEVFCAKREAAILRTSANLYFYVTNESSATNSSRNLFEGSECKYILTAQKIQRELPLTEREQKCAETAIFRLASDQIYNPTLTASQRSSVLRELKDHYFTYVKVKSRRKDLSLHDIKQLIKATVFIVTQGKVWIRNRKIKFCW